MIYYHEFNENWKFVVVVLLSYDEFANFGFDSRCILWKSIYINRFIRSKFSRILKWNACLVYNMLV